MLTQCPDAEGLAGPREAIHVDCYGNVLACAYGIIWGNTRTKPLLDIARLTYREHPILRVLIKEGLHGLSRLAESRGFIPKQEYIEPCQFCDDIRRFLRPYYPS